MGQKSQPQSDNAKTGFRKGELYFSRTLIRLQKAQKKTPTVPWKLTTQRTTHPLTTGEILTLWKLMALTSPCPSSSLSMT